LLGLLDEPSGLALRMLLSLGVNPNKLRQELRARLEKTASPGADPAAPSEEARLALETAGRESRRFGQYHVGTEHLLLALSADPRGGASEVLCSMGADPVGLRKELTERLELDWEPGPQTDPESDPLEEQEDSTQLLEEFRLLLRKKSNPDV
jgi:ATP-dependent Clp protease ATP-binding subunit ClpA